LKFHSISYVQWNWHQIPTFLSYWWVLKLKPLVTIVKFCQNYQFCINYLILSKLSILSNILIFIDLLPVPFNTSEKQDQNSNKIIWSFDNFVKLFKYWSNFIVLTTWWMVSMNSESLELPIVLVGRVLKKVKLDLYFNFFRKIQKHWN
jgi:hypothetical protein